MQVIDTKGGIMSLPYGFSNFSITVVFLFWTTLKNKDKDGNVKW